MEPLEIRTIFLQRCRTETTVLGKFTVRLEGIPFPPWVGERCIFRLDWTQQRETLLV
jgi:hypothetical protein